MYTVTTCLMDCITKYCKKQTNKHKNAVFIPPYWVDNENNVYFIQTSVIIHTKPK